MAILSVFDMRGTSMPLVVLLTSSMELLAAVLPVVLMATDCAGNKLGIVQQNKIRLQLKRQVLIYNDLSDRKACTG
jgi:hypothetical protein